MARRRFFVDQIRRGQAELTGDQAHHLVRVLRVEAGRQFEISDNQRVCLARVASARRDRVLFEVLEELPVHPPPLHLSLFVSLIKFDRLELVFEKATELGVERIVPVLAARSGKGLQKAVEGRLPRWRKIALESSQQARRTRIPELDPVVRFQDALAAAGDYCYFLDEDSAAPPIWRCLPEPSKRSLSDTVALLVGPEGGWIETERDRAIAANWQRVSLGPQVLRAETAAVAAVAVLAAAWHGARPHPR